MLGTSAHNLKYKIVGDFHSPADYLEYMFGGMQGVMYRATIDPAYYQGFYRASGLLKAAFKGVNNAYVAMNTFYRTKGLDLQEGRDVAHIKRLNALYVDIDCYKVGLSKGEVLVRLEDEYFNSRIPMPTFVIDSGRGIYLIWKLRNEDKKALSRWTAVQQYLTDELKELGADQACTDGARILRVPFSKNTKSNSYVTIQDFYDATYSLYEIAREYEIQPKKTKKKFNESSLDAVKKYPYNHATERQRKYVIDIARRLELSEEAYPDFTDYHETDNWIKLHKDISVTHSEDKVGISHYGKGGVCSISQYKSIKDVLKSYCEEIRKLFSTRKGADCKRELALFLYRYFLRELHYDSQNALKQTLEFNASLDCPFDETYVTTVTASADRRIETGIPYAYSKATIIRILGITEEELKDLPFLSSGVGSHKERRKMQNRKAYEKRLLAEGKDSKKEIILKRRASILKLQEQGLSASEIQKKLNISRATYHRDTTALAIASVMDAVKAFIRKQAENIVSSAEKAVKQASDTVVRVAHNAMHNLKKKMPKFRLSHFFSIPFIEKYSYAVPHDFVRPMGVSNILHWLSIRKRTHLSSDDSGDNSNY